MSRLQRGGVFVRADACSYRERAHVVRDSRFERRDEVRQAEVGGARVGFVRLLAQEVERCYLIPRTVRRVEADVVAVRVGAPEAYRRPRAERFLGYHLLQKVLGVPKQRPRLAPVGRVGQDGRVCSAQFPSREEGRPVYALRDFVQRVVVEGADS